MHVYGVKSYLFLPLSYFRSHLRVWGWRNKVLFSLSTFWLLGSSVPTYRGDTANTAHTHVCRDKNPMYNNLCKWLKELKITLLNISRSLLAGPKAYCKLNILSICSLLVSKLYYWIIIIIIDYFQCYALHNKEDLPSLLTACVSYGI